MKTKNHEHIKSVSDASDHGGVEGALKQVIKNFRAELTTFSAKLDDLEADLPLILQGAAESGPKK